MELPKRQTQIKTSLPYCLHKADSRFFKVGDGVNTKIRFTKKQTTPNRRTAASRGIEPIRDRWGTEAHSEVEILTDKTFDELLDAETFALEVINEFVKLYRYYDGEAVHLVPLIREDFFGLMLVNANGEGGLAVSLGGGMQVYDPMRAQRVSDSMEEFLARGEVVPLWTELLLNAQQYLYQGDFRHSILESVIALELVLSQFITKACAKKGISTDQAKSYIKDVGLTGNVKVTIRLLLDPGTELEEEILEKCQGGITIRNKIVHEGRKVVSKAEAETTLGNIKKLIDLLLPIIDKM